MKIETEVERCFFPSQLKEKMRKPVEEAIKYLRKKGWNFSKVSPMNPSTVPLKQKTLCLRKPRKKKDICRELTLEEEYSTYEPDVHDLSKVELKFDLLVRAAYKPHMIHRLPLIGYPFMDYFFRVWLSKWLNRLMISGQLS